jgi:DNA-binding NarL/FixJ family response regulator
VLVADNSADLALVLGEIIRMDPTLEFVGYVLTGAEALEKSRAGATDVLILDLGLGDCHGFEVLDHLRADASQVKVIVHTGHASAELAAHALRKGAAAYVVKDGDPEALLAAIRDS